MKSCLAVILGLCLGMLSIRSVFGSSNTEMIHLLEDVLKQSILLPQSHSSFRPSAVSSSSNQGYVYYNFFPTNDCSGSVSYQSGVVANTCLPSSDYGIPNNDSFIPTFKSFLVSGLTGRFFLDNHFYFYEYSRELWEYLYCVLLESKLYTFDFFCDFANVSNLPYNWQLARQCFKISSRILLCWTLSPYCIFKLCSLGVCSGNGTGTWSCFRM